MKWVVNFDNLETVERLDNMGILSFKPLFYEELKFVFIKTDMTESEILNIEGITKCRPERKYKLI